MERTTTNVNEYLDHCRRRVEADSWCFPTDEFPEFVSLEVDRDKELLEPGLWYFSAWYDIHEDEDSYRSIASIYRWASERFDGLVSFNHLGMTVRCGQRRHALRAEREFEEMFPMQRVVSSWVQFRGFRLPPLDYIEMPHGGILQPYWNGGSYTTPGWWLYDNGKHEHRQKMASYARQRILVQSGVKPYPTPSFITPDWDYASESIPEHDDQTAANLGFRMRRLFEPRQPKRRRRA